MGQITGTDLHDPTSTNAFGWTIMQTEGSTFSEEAVWNELVARRTSFLYNPKGAQTYFQSTSSNINRLI